MVTYRPCSVVGAGCTAPANLEDSNAAATCYACGQPVCTDSTCSTRRSWDNQGTRRVCRTCETNLREQTPGWQFVPRGSNSFEALHDGEHVGTVTRLTARRWKFAGWAAISPKHGRIVTTEGQVRSKVCSAGLEEIRAVESGRSAHPSVPRWRDLALRSTELKTALIRVPVEESLKQLLVRLVGRRAVAGFVRDAVLARLDSEGRPWEPPEG